MEAYFIIKYRLQTSTHVSQSDAKVLPTIMSLDQNGYLKNKFIGLNIRTIYVVIYNMLLMLAFLDFQNAFDKISGSKLCAQK